MPFGPPKLAEPISLSTVRPAGPWPAHLPRTRHRALTDCGLQRTHNEDAFFADPQLGLFLVCDGVGGRAFGEVAAAQTADIVSREVAEALAVLPRDEWAAADRLERMGDILRSAMQRASRDIHALAETHPRYRGMSTTATAVLVLDGWAVIGQVGDSRAYHACGPVIRQLTEDHTLLNEQVLQGLLSRERARGRTSPITRAIGLRSAVDVDISAWPLRAGDRLLVCTDGLHDYLDDALLLRLFTMDVRDAAPAAIHHANHRGGKDNITAIFIEILADPSPAARP